MEIFIAWTVFILFEQKINLNVMKKYVKIKIFVEFLCKSKNYLLKFNQYLKSKKTPCIIYASFGSLI